jgi:hypothetical protein
LLSGAQFSDKTQGHGNLHPRSLAWATRSV